MIIQTIARVATLMCGAAISSAALANMELATQKACMGCHAVDKKLVGPAYKDVAKKYADQQGAENTLIASIRKGGAGKWGPIPMPTQAALTDAETKTLATWILGGAK